MFSKLKVMQGIVLYFIFIFLFCFGDDMYSDYRTKVVRHNVNTKKQCMPYRICHMHKAKLVYLCNRVLFYLRMTKIEYKNTLYINYKVFNTNKDACKFVKVKVPPQYGFIKDSVNQIVVTCYARGPIDDSPDMNPDDYQFYEKIAIYPYKHKDLMIFEQTENRNEFRLLDWMKDVHWRSGINVVEKIFNIPVPVRKDLSASMYENNMRNIFSPISTYKCEKVQKVCILSYGRQTYTEKFVVDVETKDFKCKPEYKIVLLPNGEAVGETYICPGFPANTDPPVQTEGYRLMPGSGKNDVVLVVYNNETNIYEAVELIDNIHKEYIDLMFPRKYCSKLPTE